MHEKIDKHLIQVLSSEYEFNSDSYADLINNSISIEQSTDACYFLGEMSKSNVFNNLMFLITVNQSKI